MKFGDLYEYRPATGRGVFIMEVQRTHGRWADCVILTTNGSQKQGEMGLWDIHHKDVHPVLVR